MSVLSKLFSGGVGEILEKVGGIVDNLNLSGEEKQKFKLEMETLIQKRDSEIEKTLRVEIGAQERVMIAELEQDDKFTKRMRPTLGYSGMAIIFLNHIFIPMLGDILGRTLGNYPVPDVFWAVWGGALGIYVWGRSREKRNRVTSDTTANLLLKD